MSELRIATRGSELALWQAEHVRARLLGARSPTLAVELLVLKTTGDRVQDRPLHEVGGKGLFIKEIEEALLDGRADLAVHSMKDVPAELPGGPGRSRRCRGARTRATRCCCGPGCAPASRRARRDLLARAARRRRARRHLEPAARLPAARGAPGSRIVPLRGNVDTRLRKLEAGELDAHRAGGGRPDAARASASASTRCSTRRRCVPAVRPGGAGPPVPGGRRGDARAARAARRPTATDCAARAERAFLLRLEGSCQTPLGAHARSPAPRLTLDGASWGTRRGADPRGADRRAGRRRGAPGERAGGGAARPRRPGAAGPVDGSSGLGRLVAAPEVGRSCTALRLYCQDGQATARRGGSRRVPAGIPAGT